MASGKRPPPPPLSQRPASVYPVAPAVSQPVLPPPPASVFLSPFDSPADSQEGFEFGSSEAPDEDGLDFTPEDAAYYIPTSDGAAGAGLEDPLYDEYEDADGFFDDPFFQDGFDTNFGDPNFVAPSELASTRSANMQSSLSSPNIPVVSSATVQAPVARPALTNSQANLADLNAWGSATPNSNPNPNPVATNVPRVTMRSVQSERILGSARSDTLTSSTARPPVPSLSTSAPVPNPNATSVNSNGQYPSSSPESPSTFGSHRTTPPSGTPPAGVAASPSSSTSRPPRPEQPPAGRTRDDARIVLPAFRSMSATDLRSGISSPQREVIAPFNFDPSAAVAAAALNNSNSAATSSSSGSPTGMRKSNPSRSTQIEYLRTIYKQLWVPGAFPLGSRSYQGQPVADCFVGWQLVQWLQQKLSLQLTDARQILTDFLQNKFIVYAINVTNQNPSFDDLEQYLYRFSLPTAANGVGDAPVKTSVKPPPPPGRPASATPNLPPPPSPTSNPNLLPATNPSPQITTTVTVTPQLTRGNTQGSISIREADRLTVQEVRERPTKFLRRTTREIQTQQAERVREASWVPQEIRGDWNVSIWDDESQHAQLIVLIQEQGQTVVDSGTLNSLIRHLSSELTDMTYTKTFFVTYKAFVTREVLLPKLLQRFLVPSSFPANLVKTIQVRVVNAVLKWLELAPNDWDQGLVEQLETFIKMIRSSPEAAQHEALMKKLDKGIVEVLEGVDKERRAQHLLPPPAPLLPKQGIKSSGLQLFFDLDPLELARQMTLMDWRVFSQIKSTEMLNCAWSSEKLKHRSHHILTMISLFNKWSNWVATIITLQPSIKIRAKVMAKFIDVAAQLRALNNFSSVVAILSGLNNAAVYRLNKTKEMLKEKHRQKYDALIPLVDTSKSHRNYREAIRQAVPPVLPHLGVFLTDLTFINEGNKDVVNTNMINFKKHQMVYDVITQVRQFQLEQYNLEPQPTVQEFLTLRDDQMRSDNQLYEMSLKVEPREAQQ